MALEHETELKLFVTELMRVQACLQSLSARLLHARQHESNLRLDRPDLNLEKENKALRLRFDGETRITYKGPSSTSHGALSRTEIEVSVDDFDTALHLFQALGYSVTATYEKYRTTFEFKNCMIMLDELPFGNFVEIEGENTESLYAVAESLGLNAETAIQKSYLELFKDVREELGFEHTNLSFEAFSGIQLSPDQLGVIPSDNALS